VETQITEIMVTPHEGSSATTGKTDLVYTLRLSPKTIDGTEVRRRRLRLPPCSRAYSRVRGQHERVVSRDAKLSRQQKLCITFGALRQPCACVLFTFLAARMMARLYVGAVRPSSL